MKREAIATFIFVAVISLSFTGCDSGNHVVLGRQNAEAELDKLLSGKSEGNLVGKEAIVADSATATNVAEAILFGIYGRSQIVGQRPYEIYHIRHYWILGGTLPKTMSGGTFEIIFDDRDCRLVKISHGK